MPSTYRPWGRALIAMWLLCWSLGAAATDELRGGGEALAQLVLDRVVDGISIREDDSGQRATIHVKGRILVGGRQKTLPTRLIRDSQLIVRVNGAIIARKILGPFKPIEDDEPCCWGLPPSCWEEGCDDDGCQGHLGSCLCTCDGGGTTGGEDPALDANYSADFGPVLVKPGDHIHVSIAAAAGATPELFTLNDSQWTSVGRYGAGTPGRCRPKPKGILAPISIPGGARQ